MYPTYFDYQSTLHKTNQSRLERTKHLPMLLYSTFNNVLALKRIITKGLFTSMAAERPFFMPTKKAAKEWSSSSISMTSTLSSGLSTWAARRFWYRMRVLNGVLLLRSDAEGKGGGLGRTGVDLSTRFKAAAVALLASGGEVWWWNQATPMRFRLRSPRSPPGDAEVWDSLLANMIDRCQRNDGRKYIYL